VVQVTAAAEMSTVAKANLWGAAHPERRCTLVYTSVNGVLAFGMRANVRRVVLPLQTIASAFAKALSGLRGRTRRISASPRGGIEPPPTARERSAKAMNARVAFIPHSGLSYASLYEKTLFHSNDPASELHPAKLLHLDYSGVPSPHSDITWMHLRGADSKSQTVGNAVRAVFRGLLRVRSVTELLGVAILSGLLVRTRAYAQRLGEFSGLEVALIDYDILCPKGLLLALESRGVKTVAAQERFFMSFYRAYGTILTDYLCGSEFAAARMRTSPSYVCGRYLPVGQYRSDNLVAARRSEPPGILADSIRNGRKVVTALGFHTHLDWHNATVDPLLNWQSHQHFLEDMLRVSETIENVFVVLRYKYVDWASLPVFSDVVERIDRAPNIALSREYDEPFFSYRLCAHSSLVIAKHTSLGDEALAVGIPVLFHDYTHNTSPLLAGTFDYSPSRAMCFDYEQLVSRAREILADGGGTLAAGYDNLKREVFGGLGDGHVRSRIHAHVYAMLA
jgi:hypothetical protein